MQELDQKVARMTLVRTRTKQRLHIPCDVRSNLPSFGPCGSALLDFGDRDEGDGLIRHPRTLGTAADYVKLIPDMCTFNV
jgi:hypothetical protein